MVKAKKATKVKTPAKASTTYTLNMANGTSKVVTRKRRVPIAKAIIPKQRTPRVLNWRNLSATSLEPTDKPKKIVVILISEC